MQFLPTMLALALALTGGGVLASNAESVNHANCADSVEGHGDCNDDGCDGEQDDCTDCTNCSGCPCCPLRTGTSSPGFASLSPRSVGMVSVVTPLVEPDLSSSCADIFHPPRA